MNLNELENRLRGHAQNTIAKIESPFNLKNAINKTEINKLEGKCMNKNMSMFKRMGMIAAVVSICLITVVAANPEKGFFKDVARFDGAIVGTEYLNAQNEVTFKVIKNEIEEGSDTFELEVEFLNKDVAPFKYIQELAIPEYIVIDENGKEILNVENSLENAAKAKVEDGRVSLKLSKPQTANEKLFIEIENIYGLAKAEQPLKISGGWKLKF